MKGCSTNVLYLILCICYLMYVKCLQLKWFKFMSKVHHYLFKCNFISSRYKYIIQNKFTIILMSTLAFFSPDLGTLAFLSSNLGNLAFFSPDLGTLAFFSSDLSTLAFFSSNLGTLAFFSSNLGTLAFFSSAVMAFCPNLGKHFF